MWERGRVLEERKFNRADGDQIEVTVGSQVLEVSSCRLYHVGLCVYDKQERLDLGNRSMHGFLAGKSLAPRRVGGGRIRLANVRSFRLAIFPGRSKRRTAGSPGWLELECRITQRRSEFWSFEVVAEILKKTSSDPLPN